MKKERGFTLIELLIVIVIISLLTLASISAYMLQLSKARDAQRKTDIKKIQVAMEEYEKDHDCYPKVDLLKCDPGTGLVPYLNKIPCDPNKKAYIVELDSSGCPSWYVIYANLENKGDPEISALGCKNGCGPSLAYTYYATSPNAPEVIKGTAPAPGGSGGTNPTPTPGTGYYGCKNRVCVSLKWDNARPGPECDPNFRNSSCYSQCGSPENECVPWSNR